MSELNITAIDAEELLTALLSTLELETDHPDRNLDKGEVAILLHFAQKLTQIVIKNNQEVSY